MPPLTTPAPVKVLAYSASDVVTTLAAMPQSLVLHVWLATLDAVPMRCGSTGLSWGKEQHPGAVVAQNYRIACLEHGEEIATSSEA